MKFLLILFLLFSCSNINSQEKTFNYFPSSNKAYPLIHYSNYSVAYSEEHEQAAWVAYELTKTEVETKIAKRKDDFREDPQLSTGSSELDDYYKSGYDRGHLAPAADFCFSHTAMSESFFMTNICPQRPDFNRGIWVKLESKVRDWASENDRIFVVTGAILEDSLETIGINKVAVPNYFYKVLLDYSVPGIKAIAFLLENQGTELPLDSFVVPIDSIEILTGLDFFPEMDDYLETQLEAIVNPKEWFHSSTQEILVVSPEELIELKEIEEMEIINVSQCKGIAKSTGKRCRTIYGLSDGYCKDHQGQRE